MLRKLSASVYVGLAMLALGCSSKKEAPGGSAASSVPGTGQTGSGGEAASAPGASPSASLPPAAPVDAAAVQKLVGDWLAAQNAGDFAAYQQLYAERLEGVKRVGARTWRFDRAGWLADRRRMFEKAKDRPMRVSARDVMISGSAQAPTVVFIQSFSQGKFADEGPKRLVLTKTAGGSLQIAREELLSSTVTGAGTAGGPSGVHLTVEVDGVWRVVIGDGDQAWGTGEIRGPFAGAHTYAWRAAANPPPAASWNRRALTVFSADGSSCAATVGAIGLLGGGTPHFGEVQAWDNVMEMGDGHVWTDPERARAVYAMGGLYLVGDLSITGDCKPAFAMAEGAKPKVFAAGKASDTETAAAIAAFSKLPDYRALQTSFVGEFEGKGEWGADATVTAYATADERLLWVVARHGVGCGGFIGELGALYRVGADGKLVLASRPGDGYARVDAVLDADGDGQLEWIGSKDLYSVVTSHLTDIASAPTEAASVRFPFNDCGC